MPDEVFIDASAWVAIFYPWDQNHSSAASLWEELIRQDWPITTSNWTLYEALTFLNGKFRHDVAVYLWKLASETIDVVKAETVEKEALEMFIRFDDKDWSVVDCANFELITRHGYQQAFAFDKHFKQAAGQFGFTLLPIT